MFSAVIGKATTGKSKAEVKQAWLDLRGELLATANTYAQAPQDSSFWSLALQAFLILLREGFEAMLVITALVTYLRRQGANDQLSVIYYGVGLALAASILTAWAMQSLFQISGGAQEALEGITMLIAAGVLFYVSYWLISKSESARWQRWIEGQINQALSKGSLFALGFAAFLAVYREGAETVLFYQALAGQTNGQWLALAAGTSAAALVLLGMYWVMRNASLRLPIGLFFGITAGLLYYLAISFTGNGVLELQEAGWISITPIDWLPRITWLGLHPTLETVAAQLLLLAPLPFALLWQMKQRRQQPVVEQAG
ncbi:MAG TPA: FTR1 family iron permease [Thiolapillus brandeum]|uniref:FTR1 family iron permease n=1 Tax=Thiolapillus brandeum TaxID=1076588 RepID=A0A831NYX3_9GAMM|nr:FTR1 family iron permease [Thiolapillus brandeum]